MKLTKTAETCISQAHMQRMSAGVHENLCVEHIFFALLALARYLDPPYNKPEFVEEGKAVRAVLAPRVRSIESASWQLRKEAREPQREYVDAAAVLGRATEMAEHAGGILCADILAKAVMESPTPTILAVCESADPAYAAEDAKYPDEKPQTPPKPVERPKPVEPVKPAEPPKPAEPEKSQTDDGHTLSQLAALLAMLGSLEDSQHQNLRQSLHQRPQQHQHIKRRTKIGLITYRGGPAAGFIQYFLFGMIVPFALLCALEYFTGAVTAAPTPFVGFLINAFITLALFRLVRGFNKLMALIGMGFGHFLDLVSDCLLLMGLAESARLAYALPEIPVWMRVIVCVGALIILIFGAALYEHLKSEGDVTKTKIMFQNVEGTPGMLFFRFLTKQLILPLLIASVIWIFRFSVPLWLNKTLYILAFVWLCNVLMTMWNCLALRYKASRRRHKGRTLVRFLGVLHWFVCSPALVLYLHWLFDWFPMKTWVIVVMSVYGALALILAIATTKSILEDE